MRRFAALLLSLCLLCPALSGCAGSGVPAAAVPVEAGTLRIVATVFPLWDWTRNLLGDNPAGVELTLLLDKGTDMHSYQPSAADMVKISSCDLFLYVGGESDQWVRDALSEAVNRNMRTVNCMELLADTLKTEETVEGMQASETEAGAFDEHIWLSLKNAETCCAGIEAALTALDGGNAAVYAQNLTEYQKKLEALDGAYQAAVAPALLRSSRPAVLVFADRFPFRYLLDDYHLGYFAAFPGCEAETEASFETVAFLARKADELRVPAVLTTESPVPRLAETVVENTAAKTAQILALDSMQAVTAGDTAGGAAYLGIMGKNLDVLKEALK